MAPNSSVFQVYRWHRCKETSWNWKGGGRLSIGRWSVVNCPSKWSFLSIIGSLCWSFQQRDGYGNVLGGVYTCKYNYKQRQTRPTRVKGKVTTTKRPDTVATNSVNPLKDVRHLMNRQVPLWKAFCLQDSDTKRRSWISQRRWSVVMG